MFPGAKKANFPKSANWIAAAAAVSNRFFILMSRKLFPVRRRAGINREFLCSNIFRSRWSSATPASGTPSPVAPPCLFPPDCFMASSRDEIRDCLDVRRLPDRGVVRSTCSPRFGSISGSPHFGDAALRPEPPPPDSPKFPAFLNGKFRDFPGVVGFPLNKYTLRFSVKWKSLGCEPEPERGAVSRSFPSRTKNKCKWPRRRILKSLPVRNSLFLLCFKRYVSSLTCWTGVTLKKNVKRKMPFFYFTARCTCDNKM